MPSLPQYKTSDSAEGISLDNARSQNDWRKEIGWNNNLDSRVGLGWGTPQHQQEYH